MLQVIVPDHLRGRVMSIYALGRGLIAHRRIDRRSQRPIDRRAGDCELYGLAVIVMAGLGFPGARRWCAGSGYRWTVDFPPVTFPMMTASLEGFMNRWRRSSFYWSNSECEFDSAQGFRGGFAGGGRSGGGAPAQSGAS